MNNDNINYNGQKVNLLTPFKCFTLQEFPFIEADFDALTNYEVMCKIIEYVNKTIDQQNKLTESQKEVIEYINNYFDNLDVQNEINNKLDEMVSDGTLDRIINQEIFGNINNQIAELNEKVNNINNRKFIFIGDSYGALSENWIDILVDNLGLTYNQNAFKFAQGSYGFLGDPNVNNAKFINLLNQAGQNIQNPETITDIIVCGGVNDKTYEIGDITNAVYEFKQRCRFLFPNALVSIGFISWSNEATYLQQFPKIIQAYQNIERAGGVYIKGSESMLRYSSYLTDTVHPNRDGMSAIAKGLANYIVGKMPHLAIGQTLATSITPYQNWIVNNANMNSIILGDITNININNLELQNNDGVQMVFDGTWYQIATLRNCWICGSGQQKFPVKVTLLDSNNTTRSLVMLLKLEGLKLYICGFEKTSGTTNNLNIGVKIIMIKNASLLFPTISN